MIKVDKRDAGLWMTPPTVISAQFIFTFCNGYFCIDFKVVSGVKIVKAFLTSFLNYFEFDIHNISLMLQNIMPQVERGKYRFYCNA